MKLEQLLAAHPLGETPYNSISFSRVDGNGTLLYRVALDPKEMGAREALRVAFEQSGAQRFHCKEWMDPQPLSQRCNRDHVIPKRAGGKDHLHNMVASCGSCNRKKGGQDIIAFQIERGSEYLKALEEHLVRCLNTISDNQKALG